MWVLRLAVLSLALSWCACGIGRAEDEWSGREITQMFERHQRQIERIEELATDSSSAKRRIGELEEEVRLLRRQVTDLETTLRSIQETLSTLRLDMAKVAAVSDLDRKTAATRDVTSVTPEVAPEASAPKAAIADSNEERTGDFSVITGTVQNQTDTPLTFVVVRADFLDARGNVVKSESVYTNPQVLGPRGQASFKINTRRDHRVRRYRLMVETR